MCPTASVKPTAQPKDERPKVFKRVERSSIKNLWERGYNNGTSGQEMSTNEQEGSNTDRGTGGSFDISQMCDELLAEQNQKSPESVLNSINVNNDIGRNR